MVVVKTYPYNKLGARFEAVTIEEAIRLFELRIRPLKRYEKQETAKAILNHGFHVLRDYLIIWYN